ncbi:hypothetical protein DDE18_19305 [Nocardioides gansuensis]|uniref:DUF3311 domain-containing protein n=1 Tax=Nocardioides gansuensis TaxID=2138300 RepID=A0A2T8F6E4_9ACTN|nr:DUF3311 domain-containing protein [Nocardioides gansuensis]PVG81284.1 hypothetical protein DDE18_19305 [Nocardioides gansuensis]
MDPEPQLEQGTTGEGRRHRRALLTLVLLLIPVVAALAVPVYSRATPRLAGVHFFYWFQAGCVLLAAVCLGTALVLSGDGERPGREEARW